MEWWELRSGGLGGMDGRGSLGMRLGKAWGAGEDGYSEEYGGAAVYEG